ncbi:MAG: HAMP domain-containing sensor histidine kinase [Acidobacteriota bacterium]
MAVPTLDRLAALIEMESPAILSTWRRQVRELPSAQRLDLPTLNDHIPALLEELARAFRTVSDAKIAQALLAGSPPAHGLQRWADGFDIVEVVAEYGILRGCIHDLADRHDISLRGLAFHILNRVFDEAIGLAVQTFATEQALEVQRRREEHLAFVAHDLRTPLNAIALATRLLDDTLADSRSPTAEKMLRTLDRSVANLALLVDNVLKENANVQSAIGSSLERREFELWPLVERLIQDLLPVAATAGTTLINAVPDELRVYADASLLRRTFQNLIANAVEYSPRGQVEIGARRTADGSTGCWVRDNGAGIPADRLESIFVKGETDPERDGGLGLGLPIVKTFVEAHGGSVTVESTEGEGAVFKFTLPHRARA